MDRGKPLITRTQRLFLALWPDAGVQGQLVAHARQWTWPAGCVQSAPADWHITLHFIGNVDADRVAAIMASADVPFQPFELVLDQPRLWPHGLAVLGTTEVPMPLRALYDRLGHALRGLDLAVETRPYQPHVTFARRAGAAIPPAAPAPVVWWARSFVLVVSTGDRAQPYRVFRQYADGTE
jgi:2'-5' RNA ligase